MTQQFINERILEQLRYLCKIKLREIQSKIDATSGKITLLQHTDFEARNKERIDSAEAQLSYFEGFKPSNLELTTTV